MMLLLQGSDAGLSHLRPIFSDSTSLSNYTNNNNDVNIVINTNTIQAAVDQLLLFDQQQQQQQQQQGEQEQTETDNDEIMQHDSINNNNNFDDEDIGEHHIHKVTNSVNGSVLVNPMRVQIRFTSLSSDNDDTDKDTDSNEADRKLSSSSSSTTNDALVWISGTLIITTNAIYFVAFNNSNDHCDLRIDGSCIDLHALSSSSSLEEQNENGNFYNDDDDDNNHKDENEESIPVTNEIDNNKQISKSNTLCVYVQLCSTKDVGQLTMNDNDNNSYWELYIQPLTVNETENENNKGKDTVTIPVDDTLSTYLCEQISKLVSFHPTRPDDSSNDDDNDNDNCFYNSSSIDNNNNDDFVCADNYSLNDVDPEAYDDADEDEVAVFLNDDPTKNIISSNISTISFKKSTNISNPNVDDVYCHKKKQQKLINDDPKKVTVDNNNDIDDNMSPTDDERQAMLDRLDRMLIVPDEYKIVIDKNDDNKYENSDSDMNVDAVFSDDDNINSTCTVNNNNGQFDDAE